MRTFLELLPHIITQALVSRLVRVRRVLHHRRRTANTRRRVYLAVDEHSRGGTPPPSEARRRIFVDLAVISEQDAGTGIQRVVRALALALLGEARQSGAQWDIRFVSAKRKTRYHCVAWPNRADCVEADEMRARPNDVFLGLDYSLDAVRRHRDQLAQFRRDGGMLWFLVHDLLPLNRTEWFSRNTVIRFRAWLDILATLGDGFLCNSPQTEMELKEALRERYGLVDGFRTQVLPMGHAILNNSGNALVGHAAPRFDTSTSFALMVGTLEPRKGHADVVAAFDRLWQSGSCEKLVLVGRLGWHVEALRDLILTHPEHGSRLMWLYDVEDAELSHLYQACTGVIIASHGEGFGLPLIEALGCGKPVLARDLPIFRMHEGKGVQFFPVTAGPDELACAARQWLDAAHQGLISIARPTSDWKDAALVFLAAVETK